MPLPKIVHCYVSYPSDQNSDQPLPRHIYKTNFVFTLYFLLHRGTIIAFFQISNRSATFTPTLSKFTSTLCINHIHILTFLQLYYLCFSFTIFQHTRMIFFYWTQERIPIHGSVIFFLHSFISFPSIHLYHLTHPCITFTPQNSSLLHSLSQLNVTSHANITNHEFILLYAPIT